MESTQANLVKRAKQLNPDAAVHIERERHRGKADPTTGDSSTQGIVSIAIPRGELLADLADLGEPASWA